MNENSDVKEEHHENRGKRHFLKFLRNMLVGSVVVYGIVLGYLVYNETSLVYPGAKDISNWNPDFEFEEVTLDSTEGAKIHGWFLPKTNAKRNILLHHGNEEDVAQVSERYARKLAEAANANVFVYDYRGFGKSQGEPHETGVIDDAETALTWLLKKTKLSKAEQGIIYFGSSLGGGVALGLAERHPPQRLILDRTFDAITTAGAERYPYVPVKLLMRNRFESLERIKSLDVPLFQSHYTNDELCSLKSARKLFEASPSLDKQFFEMKEGGHYDPLPDEYWVELKSYFASIDSLDNFQPTKTNPDQ